MPGKYLEINRNWKDGDEVSLTFEMKGMIISGDPRRKDIKNKVCIRYGPLIYCLEQKDNENIDINEIQIQENIPFTVIHKDNLLGGINIIEGTIASGEKFVAIPYYAWNNRGPDKMLIWCEKG